jgi:hypothetical protein
MCAKKFWIELSNEAIQTINALPVLLQDEVRKAIDALAENPHLGTVRRTGPLRGRLAFIWQCDRPPICPEIGICYFRDQSEEGLFIVSIGVNPK